MVCCSVYRVAFSTLPGHSSTPRPEREMGEAPYASLCSQENGRCTAELRPLRPEVRLSEPAAAKRGTTAKGTRGEIAKRQQRHIPLANCTRICSWQTTSKATTFHSRTIPGQCSPNIQHAGQTGRKKRAQWTPQARKRPKHWWHCRTAYPGGISHTAASCRRRESSPHAWRSPPAHGLSSSRNRRASRMESLYVMSSQRELRLFCDFSWFHSVSCQILAGLPNRADHTGCPISLARLYSHPVY